VSLFWVLLVPSIVTFSGFQLLEFSCASSVVGDTIANAVNDMWLLLCLFFLEDYPFAFYS
jgi:hypothetical protein